MQMVNVQSRQIALLLTVEVKYVMVNLTFFYMLNLDKIFLIHKISK